MNEDEHYGESLKNRINEWLENVLNYTSFGGGRKEFSTFEYKLILHIFKCFVEYEPKIASWLFKYIDVNKVKFVWNSSCCDNGIIGSFTPLRPNTITISDLNKKKNIVEHGCEFEKEDISGVLVVTYDQNDVSNIIVKHHSLNTKTCDLMLLNFPTIIHEMIHMFQFGVPCRFVEGMSIWDKFLMKVVQPVGYVFNRLVTLFIDNPLVDAICKKIYEVSHPNDLEFNRDNIHLPFFYKFTLEHDVDKMTEDSERLEEFSEKMEKALACRTYEERQNPDNPERKHIYDSYSEQEREQDVETYHDTIKTYIEEYGEQFWKWAGELYDMHKEERDRIIKLYNL